MTRRAAALAALVHILVAPACTDRSTGGPEDDLCDVDADPECDDERAADDDDADDDASNTCPAGEVRTCDGGGGFQVCNAPDGQARGTWGQCVHDGGGDTPLLLSFGAPVRYRQGGEPFDLNGAMSVATDWPAAETPWLVLDRDGDGRITDGRELFGSMTPLRGGGVGDNGFAALAELDADRDGRLTPHDPAWSALRLWADRDGDRRSAPAELRSLDDLGLLAISLAYHVDRRCDDRGNCEVERAAVVYRDALGFERVGEVIDVHLRHR